MQPCVCRNCRRGFQMVPLREGRHSFLFPQHRLQTLPVRHQIPTGSKSIQTAGPTIQFQWIQACCAPALSCPALSKYQLGTPLLLMAAGWLCRPFAESIRFCLRACHPALCLYTKPVAGHTDSAVLTTREEVSLVVQEVQDLIRKVLEFRLIQDSWNTARVWEILKFLGHCN